MLVVLGVLCLVSGSDIGTKMCLGSPADYFCLLLAGEQPHDVPVPRKNTELHQISKHTQNLQQELLGAKEKRHVSVAKKIKNKKSLF